MVGGEMSGDLETDAAESAGDEVVAVRPDRRSGRDLLVDTEPVRRPARTGDPPARRRDGSEPPRSSARTAAAPASASTAGSRSTITVRIVGYSWLPTPATPRASASTGHGRRAVDGHRPAGHGGVQRRVRRRRRGREPLPPRCRARCARPPRSRCSARRRRPARAAASSSSDGAAATCTVAPLATSCAFERRRRARRCGRRRSATGQPDRSPPHRRPARSTAAPRTRRRCR